MRRLFAPVQPFPGQRPVVTIGMFDGMHMGHQKVISQTLAHARLSSQPSLAITFDVHPRKITGTAPPMITSLEHRLQLLEQLGLDATLVLSFTDTLAQTPAADFTRDYLIDLIGISSLFLGHDAHFGKDRDGTAEMLTHLSDDFTVHTVEPEIVDGKPVSSTTIRELVQAGDLPGAARMLGRPVSVLGTVVHGKGLGRKLGYPTLNLDPHHELCPPRGVYLSRTRCGETLWNSVTNIGHRPVQSPETPGDLLVESHLLEYSGNLYGQTVEVVFLKKLRDEQSFPSQEQLVEQVARDKDAAELYHQGLTNPS